MWEPLPPEFSARDTTRVARALLGQHVVHVVDGVHRVGRIVETEAYLGPKDLACHSSKGRTPRTEVMFGPPHHAYVYLIYGMHLCLNVVTGNGAAVLIRALEPVSGLDDVRTDGPGRLTKALGLSLVKHNAKPLHEGALFLAKGTPVAPRHIRAGPRIGIDSAGEWVSAPLRFIDLRSRFVSAK
ncbi:MAG: DNA-3-methyladenine glycosylase [Archangium sp.]